MMNDVFLRYPGGFERAVTFSYDDSDMSNIRLKELFDKYGAKCTFNLNSGFFTDEDFIGEHRYLKYSEAKKLFYNSGHEVAVHGYTHPFFDLFPDGMTAYEIVKDREILEELTKKPIHGMAFPNGPVNGDKAYPKRITDLLKSCGIYYARTTLRAEDFRLPEDWHRLKVTCHHTDPDLMELAKKFADTPVDRIPRLFYVWGHSFEFARNDSWDIMENLLLYLSKFNNIWYATNIEVYNYVSAYKSLQFDVKGTMAYNPSCMPVYVCKNGKTVKINPNETENLK